VSNYISEPAAIPWAGRADLNLGHCSWAATRAALAGIIRVFQATKTLRGCAVL